jgi:hypothetical protein
VPSRGELHEAALMHARIECGACAPGDVLWLMSDATAEWFLRRAYEGDAVLDELDGLLAAERTDDLSTLFQQERHARRIKDDDVACVRIQLIAG